jgi:[acyl-carrier-protein] S-malonyltransferase
MSSIACVFPGQGSQHPEMLKTDLVDQSFINEKIQIVSEILSSDVQSILEDESKLNLTSFTQPLLVLSSAIFSEAYKNLSLPDPKVIAGHSLGEYSALMFAESITFEDAIKITYLRGNLMQSSEEGKMMAILGLDAKTIDEACSQINESNEKAYVASANYNSMKQTVIAGNIEGIEIASNLLPGIGAKRCIELNVSIASHTRLMTDAADEFNESLEKIVFSLPRYPIIQNYTGEIETDLSSIKQNLLNQLTKPVLWTKTMNKISNSASCIIEIGPKNILCGLSKGYDLQSILYMSDLNFRDKVQNI